MARREAQRDRAVVSVGRREQLKGELGLDHYEGRSWLSMPPMSTPISAA